MRDLLIILFSLIGLSLAQSVEECMECHSDKAMTKITEDSEEISLYVDLERFKQSVHGEMICTDCHSSLENIEHEEDLPRVNCADCHPDVQEILSKSVHGVENLSYGDLSVYCSDCHGAHDIFRMSDPRSNFSKLNGAKTCGECHIEEKNQYLKSIHWHAVSRGHFESPVCNDCHGEHHILSPQAEDALTNRLTATSRRSSPFACTVNNASPRSTRSPIFRCTTTPTE